MCQNKIHTLPRCHKHLIFKVFLAIFLALIVASSAFAFGGGGKSRKSSVYRGTGVDSIGIHFNGKGGDSEEESEETCPAEKQCGDYCCQGDNICQKNEAGEFQCCNEKTGHCCVDNQSAYKTPWTSNSCCSGSLYCYGRNEDGTCRYDWFACCPSTYELHNDYCCNGKIFIGAGVDGADMCCSADTQPSCSIRNKEGVCKGAFCCPGDVTKRPEGDVCYAAEFTGCKTNSDCDSGEYCKLTGDKCKYPSEGVCTAIGDYLEPENEISGLGRVKISLDDRMTWWSADNWCKAQGMHLPEVEKFNCYMSGTSTPVISGIDRRGACCAGDDVECEIIGDWFYENKRDKYSPILYELKQAIGEEHWGWWYYWTASRVYEKDDDGCFYFNISLAHADVGVYNRDYLGMRALCVND